MVFTAGVFDLPVFWSLDFLKVKSIKDCDADLALGPHLLILCSGLLVSNRPRGLRFFIPRRAVERKRLARHLDLRDDKKAL